MTHKTVGFAVGDMGDVWKPTWIYLMNRTWVLVHHEPIRPRFLVVRVVEVASERNRLKGGRVGVVQVDEHALPQRVGNLAIEAPPIPYDASARAIPAWLT